MCFCSETLLELCLGAAAVCKLSGLHSGAFSRAFLYSNYIFNFPTKCTWKVKFTLEQAMKPRGGAVVQLYCLCNLGARWGEWSATRPGLFTTRKDPVFIAQEAGWAPRPVWTGAENLAPTGIRSPDRPVRSQSLYRLSYPAHHKITIL